MIDPQYYRRQADLCLRLALMQADQQFAFRLIELAEGYQARAGEAASDADDANTPPGRRARTGEAAISD
jgi:hypothetical protein